MAIIYQVEPKCWLVNQNKSTEVWKDKNYNQEVKAFQQE